MDDVSTTASINLRDDASHISSNTAGANSRDDITRLSLEESEYIPGYTDGLGLSPCSREKLTGPYVADPTSRGLLKTDRKGHLQQPRQLRKIQNAVSLWKWEIFHCLCAMGLLSAIYGILHRYDNQRLPTWNWGVTINLSTLAAIMATILRSLLAIVVAEIIGQGMWEDLAAQDSSKGAPVRRLIETSRFYDATRGVLGAAKLLPRILLRDPVTVLAVIVMVALLGVGPFVQQAIETRSCQSLLEGTTSSVPIARNVTRVEGLNGRANRAALQSAFNFALASEDNTDASVAGECSTGNCTVQNAIGGVYSTLGVCSSVVDSTSLISTSTWETAGTYTSRNYTGGQLNVTVFWQNHTIGPGGLQVLSHWSDNTDADAGQTGIAASGLTLPFAYFRNQDVDWLGDLAPPDMKALGQWGFMSATILSSNWLVTNSTSGYTDFVAVTFTLYPCLRSYTGSFTNGKLNEVLVDTAPLVPNMAPLFVPEIEQTTVGDGRFLHLTTLNFTIDDEGSDLTFWQIGLSQPIGTPWQAVQSPCLVGDNVWTKGNMSSTVDDTHQPLLLLHTDVDSSGELRVTAENTTAPQECIYSIDRPTMVEFSNILGQTIFSGSCALVQLESNPSNWQTSGDFDLECDNSLPTYPVIRPVASFYNINGTSADTLIAQIQAFTDRVSNKLRKGLLNTPEFIPGQVFQSDVCTQVQYSWLAFPTVLTAATCSLLLWTLFRSWRRRGRGLVWKTSILPFLLYGDRFVVDTGEDMSTTAGLPNEVLAREGDRQRPLDLDQLQREAKQQKVRFALYT